MNKIKNIYYMLPFVAFSDASVVEYYYTVTIALVLQSAATGDRFGHVKQAELRISLDQVLKKHLVDWNAITTYIDTHRQNQPTAHQNIVLLAQTLDNNIQVKVDEDLQQRIPSRKPIGPSRNVASFRPVNRDIAGSAVVDYALDQSEIEVLASMNRPGVVLGPRDVSQAIPEGPPRPKLVREPRASSSDQEDDDLWARQPRQHQGQIPVMYMAGDTKRKRKCAQVNGILAGFNTFSYLTFVNGVITLILNANNNINNNNNNNNINNNNDLSNNNLNSNSNTQNANQVIIMPPGRKKRRSIIEATPSTQDKSFSNCIKESTTTYELYRLCNLQWQIVNRTVKNIFQGKTPKNINRDFGYLSMK